MVPRSRASAKNAAAAFRPRVRRMFFFFLFSDEYTHRHQPKLFFSLLCLLLLLLLLFLLPATTIDDRAKRIRRGRGERQQAERELIVEGGGL